MSIKTRVNGFTPWGNLRIRDLSEPMNNIYLDLLTGTFLKKLIESFTARDLPRLDTFDNLTVQQKTTRTDWIVQELKDCEIFPEEININSRLFSMKSNDHVFDFLFQLTGYDIHFIWERAEYLQHTDPAVLVKVPFTWTPEKVESKNQPAVRSMYTETDPEEKFPGTKICKSYKHGRKLDKDEYPHPEDCIIEMINHHLKTNQAGRKQQIISIDDLADHRLMCALVNSFVPQTFTAEVLPNDRWSINLCLRTAEEMFRGESSFTATDLVEADSMAVCSYFCYFFMIGYKYRQTKAVVDRLDMLQQTIRESRHISEGIPEDTTNEEQKKKLSVNLKNIERSEKEIETIREKFDVEYCRDWVREVFQLQQKTYQQIRDKILEKFDILTVPRTVTMSELSSSFHVSLALCGGSGFYLNDSTKEKYTEMRKIILRSKATGQFIDDFTAGKGKDVVPIRKLLKLRTFDMTEINPCDYPQYEMYFEASSPNKILKAGTEFLYQVFPGNLQTWHKKFIKITKENEVESVRNLVKFFEKNLEFINGKEEGTGNTALHWAARCGCYHIVLYLLEHGAQIDAQNNTGQTPLFVCIEGMHKKIARLLIEWGCDVNIRNHRALTAFETTKNEDFRDSMIDLYEHFSTIVPEIVNGDTSLLKKLVREHVTGVQELCSLRSRCINGSTVLHTAAYFGCMDILLSLLSHGINVNLLDYKGATPLHRVREAKCMQSLIDASAHINALDIEGNTPLHVKCYGETGKATEMECIQLLLRNRAQLAARNNKGLMPIHCCAMQGRMDGLDLLIKVDVDQGGEMDRALQSDSAEEGPPSLLHLALANDHVECGHWLLDNGFGFKPNEQDMLVERFLTNHIKSSRQAEVLSFLFDHGASVTPIYSEGNTALHYAATILGNTSVLELLLQYGAEIDAFNCENSTPLCFACQTNNMYAACILISKGANFRLKNNKGQTAFDFVSDFDEWIESGFFTEEVRARLKAYSLKHSRDLVRAISQKVAPGGNRITQAGDEFSNLNFSKALFKPLSPPPRTTIRQRVPKTSMPIVLYNKPSVPDSDKGYPNLQPPGSYVMF